MLHGYADLSHVTCSPLWRDVDSRRPGTRRVGNGDDAPTIRALDQLPCLIAAVFYFAVNDEVKVKIYRGHRAIAHDLNVVMTRVKNRSGVGHEGGEILVSPDADFLGRGILCLRGRESVVRQHGHPGASGVEKQGRKALAIMRSDAMVKGIHDMLDVRDILWCRRAGTHRPVRCCEAVTEHQKDDPNKSKVFHECVIRLLPIETPPSAPIMTASYVGRTTPLALGNRAIKPRKTLDTASSKPKHVVPRLK